MKSPPTMQDVAIAAGYSRATVSLALRGSRAIPEKTRQHIVATAERLNYRMNPMVSALMKQQRNHRPAPTGTAVIAFITTYPPGEDWRRYLAYAGMHAGAAASAERRGCRLEEFPLAVERMTPARLAQILRARSIHAAIVAPLPEGSTRLDFDFSDLAVVGLGMSVQQPCLARVASDHFQSAKLAVERCASLGYRRIGLVLSRETSQRLDHRYEGGYRLAIEHLRLPRLPLLMTEHACELAPAMPKWIEKCHPDVVILDNADSDQHAQVPPHVGIVCLAVDQAEGRLAGIYQNHALIGQAAVEQVVAKLQASDFGPAADAHLYLVEGKWVNGASAPGPGNMRASGEGMDAKR